jgi:MYXO-CTERM domain-containing protein
LRRFIASFIAIACFSLVLMIPAFAEGTTGTTGTTSMNPYNAASRGTIYDGTVGTRSVPGTGYGTTGTGYGTTGTGYGTTGTGVGTYGAYDTTRMNAYNPAGTRYRTTATTTGRNSNWGWLGLLGLFGLAGMRSRNREEIK